VVVKSLVFILFCLTEEHPEEDLIENNERRIFTFELPPAGSLPPPPLPPSPDKRQNQAAPSTPSNQEHLDQSKLAIPDQSKLANQDQPKPDTKNGDRSPSEDSFELSSSEELFADPSLKSPTRNVPISTLRANFFQQDRLPANEVDVNGNSPMLSGERPVAIPLIDDPFSNQEESNIAVANQMPVVQSSNHLFLVVHLR
jgi:hypothetical protein